MTTRSHFIIFIITFVTLFLPVCGQTSPPANTKIKLEDIAIGPPELFGEVVRVSGEYRLRIDNNDEKRQFQGFAIVSFGNATQLVETVKVKLSVAPRENALHLLYSMPTIGEQYKLIVTDLEGNVVIHKIAPIKSITDPVLPAPPPQALSATPLKNETINPAIRIKPRLAGGSNDHDPYLLTFEINAGVLINNAMFRLSAKGLSESRPLTFNGATMVEFKLPDELEVQKLSYSIVDAKGEIIASGEADLVQLMNADDVAIGDIRLDKASYKPGETVKLTVAYVGNIPNGIRVEITVKDLTGKILFRDLRKEKREGGLPTHDFSFALAKDSKEAATIEIKVFDAEANTVLDTTTKDIIITNN